MAGKHFGHYIISYSLKKKSQTLDFTQLWQMQNPMVKKTEFCHWILHGIEKNM